MVCLRLSMLHSSGLVFLTLASTMSVRAGDPLPGGTWDFVDRQETDNGDGTLSVTRERWRDTETSTAGSTGDEIRETDSVHEYMWWTTGPAPAIPHDIGGWSDHYTSRTVYGLDQMANRYVAEYDNTFTGSEWLSIGPTGLPRWYETSKDHDWSKPGSSGSISSWRDVSNGAATAQWFKTGYEEFDDPVTGLTRTDYWVEYDENGDPVQKSSTTSEFEDPFEGLFEAP